MEGMYDLEKLTHVGDCFDIPDGKIWTRFLKTGKGIYAFPAESPISEDFSGLWRDTSLAVFASLSDSKLVEMNISLDDEAEDFIFWKPEIEGEDITTVFNLKYDDIEQTRLIGLRSAGIACSFGALQMLAESTDENIRMNALDSIQELQECIREEEIRLALQLAWSCAEI